MIDVLQRLPACVAVAVLAAAAPRVFADVAITAVPPADYRGGTITKATAVVRMALPPVAPARRIALPEPTPAERDALRSRNASRMARNGRMTKASLAIGFPRSVPAGLQTQALEALPWQALADGTRAAKVDIVSPGAAALRVALNLSVANPGVSLRFIGNGSVAQPFGPVSAETVISDAARFGSYWSPVLDGDAATIELHVEGGAQLPRGTLTITTISHQVVAPASLRRLDAKAVSDIGLAGPCEIDVACVKPQSSAFADSAKAVAELEFTQSDGFTHLCTGTLLNDSVASNKPYLFTAAHCIDSALAARTLNTYWFFDAVECGSRAVPPYVQQASGAALLARSPDWDWALVRLNAAPPPGSRFSAWRAEPIPTLTPVTVFHHPQADLKKWSEGSMQGYQQYSDGTSYAVVQYDQGTTEPGSSGAGLLTFFQGGGYYELRGGLWTGAASCEFRAGQDEYSRLDDMLPLTRQYLAPDTSGTPGQVVAVEYYHRALDHYFMTILPLEIDALDSGIRAGWERTGLRFLAYAGPTPGAMPVCRFYRTPGFGDSHFYSAIPFECAAVIANPQLFPGWTEETASALYIGVPDPVKGTCAPGTQPIWRFYNKRTINHRYTTDRMVRDEMRADPRTWEPEGYPPDNVTMCAPLGT